MNGTTPQEEHIYRLQRAINDFKKYDAGRKNYIAEQDKRIEKLTARVAELEALTEQQHGQIDELIDSYEKANGFVGNEAGKAYVKELLDKISTLKTVVRLADRGIIGDKMSLIQELTALRKGAATMRTKISCLRKEVKMLRKMLRDDED